jgi:predicted kinase
MDNHLVSGRVILMAGIPGSGKTHYTNNKLGAHESVSADAGFVGSDGVYRFDPARLGAAHGDCLRAFVSALMKGAETVVVDNTNTTAIEMAPYVALAAAYGYVVEIVRFACDPAVAAARNVHGVPERACRAMAERLERTFQDGLPPFWNVTVSIEHATPPIQGEASDALDRPDGPGLATLNAVYRVFPVSAKRVNESHWCGYLTVPKNHPWVQAACRDHDGKWSAPDEVRLPLDVHGGCTYARLQEDGGLKVGFDCAHCSDGQPPWSQERSFLWGTYRDLAYVRAQLLSLAEQAEQAANG